MPTAEAIALVVTDERVISRFEDTQSWNEHKHKLGKSVVRIVRFISSLDDHVTDSDRSQLVVLDDAARDEAMESGELVYYHAGDIDENGNAESWCAWNDAEASLTALHGSEHREAVTFALGKQIYKYIRIEIMDATLNEEGEYDLHIVRVIGNEDLLKHTNH